MNEAPRIIECFPPRKGEDDSGKTLLKRYWYVWIPVGLVLHWLASR